MMIGIGHLRGMAPLRRSSALRIVYCSQSICGLLGACENSVDDDLSGCTGLLYVP